MWWEHRLARKLVSKEIYSGECRVAHRYNKVLRSSFDVLIESGLALPTFLTMPTDKCQIVPDALNLWGAADIVLKVRPPDMHEVELLLKVAR